MFSNLLQSELVDREVDLEEAVGRIRVFVAEERIAKIGEDWVRAVVF